MNLDEDTQPTLQDGRPAIDAPHQASQSCVKDVDLDINPLSPFHPRRRLGWQS